jgi:hypothetical protein
MVAKIREPRPLQLDLTTKAAAIVSDNVVSFAPFLVGGGLGWLGFGHGIGPTSPH